MGFLDVLLNRTQNQPLSGEPTITLGPQGPPPPEELGGDVVQKADPDTISDELQMELMSLQRKAVETSDVMERLQVQRTRRCREYFSGKMNSFYAEDIGAFLPINSTTMSGYGISDDDDNPEPLLSWNLYRATGLYIIAVLSGGPPTVRFFPANADNALDLATAKASNTITELFYRTNDIDSMIAREAFFLYNDGVFFAYTRHVLDAQRFGTHDEDIIENQQVQLSEDAFGCANCGVQTPASHVAGQMSDGAMPGGPPGTPAPGPGCATCGTPIDPMSFVPGQTTTVPQKTGTKKVPNGAEVLDIFGRLEVRVPPTAKSRQDCQWLQLRTDADVSQLRFEFQDLADKIQPGEPNDGVSMESRLARISTQGGGWQSPGGYAADDGGQVVTYTRTWLRPSIFFRVMDEDRRNQLLAMFPKGCYVAFAGNTFLKARNESMDDFWTICHAEPGEGMVRPSIGEILLDPQDALNDLMDSELQNARMSVPQVFVDSRTVDRRAWMMARQRGGNMFPVTRQGGESIGDNFFQTSPASTNAGAQSLRQEVFGPISQYLSATLPGMTGQSDPNLKTARAYAQAREQAMGRMGIAWRSIKQAHVEIVTQAVQLYIKFRTADVTLPQITPAGFANDTIKLDDLHGQVVAYPESDEAYPMSASDRRQVFEQILQNPDPTVHGIATELDNLEYAKGTMGWGTLVMPGEKSRAKQMSEIQEMLKAAPTQIPDPSAPPPPPPQPPPPMMGPLGPLIHPATGQPIPSGPPPPPPPPAMKPAPSIPVQKETDEHQIEFKTCQSWLHSEAGLEAKASNPDGYQNVLLHAIDHQQAMQPPPPPPAPPEPIVVSDTAHLVAPDGSTLWSPPGEGPGAAGPQGALDQPSTKPVPAPSPHIEIHQPGSGTSSTVHQPGSISAPPKAPRQPGGPPPRPEPGPVPAPNGPPTPAPPPGAGGQLHPGQPHGPKPLKPFGVQ